MSKASFQFPLRAGDIAEFCHPSPDSGLDRPHFLDLDLHAGNGHIAIRARRGLWLESDFEPPSYEFRERLGNLPWGSFPDASSPEWRALDDIRGHIYKRAVISPFNEQGKRQPSPIWKIGGAQYIRLSHLQLIARLPGAKVYAGPLTRFSPMYFTFNGGTVLVPRDEAIIKPDVFEIFSPAFDRFDQTRIARHSPVKTSYVPKPIPDQPIDDWPPAEPQD